MTSRKLLLAIAVLLLAPSVSWSSLRVDGTQLQSASSVATTSGEQRVTEDGRVVSGGKKVLSTFGQALIAKGDLAGTSETAVRIGIGYPYNILFNSPYGCNCPNQGDFDNDSHRTVTDLSAMIDATFFNGPLPQDPLCPIVRFDIDCDGLLTAVDVAKAIDYVFFGGPPACNPCASE